VSPAVAELSVLNSWRHIRPGEVGSRDVAKVVNSYCLLNQAKTRDLSLAQAKFVVHRGVLVVVPAPELEPMKDSSLHEATIAEGRRLCGLERTYSVGRKGEFRFAVGLLEE